MGYKLDKPSDALKVVIQTIHPQIKHVGLWNHSSAQVEQRFRSLRILQFLSGSGWGRALEPI